MTRLTEKDINGLGQEISNYDIELVRKTGMNLTEIACFAAGTSLQALTEAAQHYQVSVIPITAGQGVIGGFAYSVASIVNKLGFQVSVTKHSDVSGFYEAVSEGKEILFMADDDRFVAINLRTKKIADNGEATARGYVAALCAMAQGLKEKDVLVLGYGQVGSKAVDFLLQLGAKVAVYELDRGKLEPLSGSFVKIENNLNQALSQYQYLVDATPANGFISTEIMHPEGIIAAPGIPLGLTTSTFEQLKERVIHDPLQIGVAAMLALAIVP